MTKSLPLSALVIAASSFALHACALAAPATATTAATAANAAQPKLVVVLVVDGLPNEQVQRYRDQFGKGTKGGLGRMLAEGAAFSNAHQAHGVTVTAIGHTAVLTGAYPYVHGIIGNNWIDPTTKKSVYCTEDTNYTYIGEQTEPSDGTAPTRLRVDTLGDQLRYASGNRSKVITVSGKDRGAILLAGKTGTPYMYMEKTGNFASSTFYMQAHPAWVTRYLAGKPQDRYYGKTWSALLADAAYAGDAHDDLTPAKPGGHNRLPYTYYSESGQIDAAYYNSLKTGPYLDQLTLDFARAAVEGENLGRNDSGVPDLLGVSLSAHDYVNHAYGPESKLSHDHLQRVDRMLGEFFNYLDQRIGMDNVLVVLTADHGFANTAEFSNQQRSESKRINGDQLMKDLGQHLSDKFGGAKLLAAWSLPNIHLDYAAADKAGLRHADVEDAAAQFLLHQPGISDTFTRTQFESGAVTGTRIATLMRRAWNREASGDLMVITRPYWYFASGATGTTHGSPYAYDTNVPLMIMGKRWIKPGYYGQYAEVVDIAPTLANILRVRPPAGSEGRVLVETLK